MILRGDCLEQMKSLADNSIDSIVSDPPYGLSFMGKKWDYSVPSKEIWIEALRVLKPGGHLLAFGGTRTYHRLVVNIEDAGFEIRDQVMWIYGSGFPKSMSIDKAIDKQAGAKREVIGIKGTSPDIRGNSCDSSVTSQRERLPNFETAPTTDLAKQWQGWGTALKPAHEPICVARKPIEKGLTVAENVIKWGCGAINIDESRISTSDNLNGGAYSNNRATSTNEVYGEYQRLNPEDFKQPQGRWPANVLFDECAASALDEMSGECKSAGKYKDTNREYTETAIFNSKLNVPPSNKYAGQSGGASRFFYVAKASKRERNAGLEGMSEKIGAKQFNENMEGKIRSDGTVIKEATPQSNFHPTVKPIKLMEYLIKLVTPRGGTVLDPFAGSGSTGVAAKRLGFNFIGCELNPEYADIAEKRIAHADVSA